MGEEDLKRVNIFVSCIYGLRNGIFKRLTVWEIAIIMAVGL